MTTEWDSLLNGVVTAGIAHKLKTGDELTDAQQTRVGIDLSSRIQSRSLYQYYQTAAYLMLDPEMDVRVIVASKETGERMKREFGELFPNIDINRLKIEVV